MQCPFIHHKWALNWINEVESAEKAIIVLSKGDYRIGLKKSLKIFEFQLNVEDIDKDLKILNTRNDFLHGQAPDITKSGKNRPLDRYNKDLYYSALRFYTLLNMLILKWIGYDNYVINYPRILHESTGILLDDEPPYRKL